MGIREEIDRLVRETIEEERRQIEEAVEMSLVDEKQRGVVLVQDEMGRMVSVGLSDLVPYGNIYVVKRPDYLLDPVEALRRFNGAGPVSPPTEGGGGA